MSPTDSLTCPVSLADAVRNGDDPLNNLNYFAALGLTVRTLDDLPQINDAAAVASCRSRSILGESKRQSRAIFAAKIASLSLPPLRLAGWTMRRHGTHRRLSRPTRLGGPREAAARRAPQALERHAPGRRTAWERDQTEMETPRPVRPAGIAPRRAHRSDPKAQGDDEIALSIVNLSPRRHR